MNKSVLPWKFMVVPTRTPTHYRPSKLPLLMTGQLPPSNKLIGVRFKAYHGHSKRYPITMLHGKSTAATPCNLSRVLWSCFVAWLPRLQRCRRARHDACGGVAGWVTPRFACPFVLKTISHMAEVRSLSLSLSLSLHKHEHEYPTHVVLVSDANVMRPPAQAGSSP